MNPSAEELQQILQNSTGAEIGLGMVNLYERMLANNPVADRVLRQEINVVDAPITGTLLTSQNVAHNFGQNMADYIRRHWPRSIAAAAPETLVGCELLRFFTDRKVHIYVFLQPKTRLPEIRVPIGTGKSYVFWRLDHKIPPTRH